MENLKKYINRSSVMINGAESVCNITNLEDDIEFITFKVNQLTKSICPVFLNNGPEKNKIKTSRKYNL